MKNSARKFEYVMAIERDKMKIKMWKLQIFRETCSDINLSCVHILICYNGWHGFHFEISQTLRFEDNKIATRGQSCEQSTH